MRSTEMSICRSILLAYIGSSNLTHSAMVTGLEWNVRVSGVRNADVVAKMAAVFDSYWASGDFIPFDRDQFRQRTELTEPEQTLRMSPIEVVLMPFQERLLEQVEVARTLGRHRNLLVAATGTGKTVIAAVDYARLRERLPRDRLLFVAHREEIGSLTTLKISASLTEGLAQLWEHPQVRRELLELLDVFPERVDHLHAGLN